MSAGAIAASAIMSVPISSAYRSAVMLDGPIAYWPLDETSGTNADDISGNNRDGTYVNNPTLAQAGLLPADAGTSVLLDGTDDHISIVNDNAYDVDFITVEGWIRTTQTTGAPQIIGRDTANNLSTNGRSFQLRLNLGKPEFLCFVGASSGLFTGTVTTAAGPVSIADGYPHHVVGTYDGVSAKVYVDGVQVGSVARTGYLCYAREPMLGARWDVGSGPFNFLSGRISHAAYYNYALSAARILAHYQAGGVPTDVYATQVLADSPLAYWRLWDAAGSSVAYDSSGNGRHGSILTGGLEQPGLIPALSNDKSMYIPVVVIPDADWMDVANITVKLRMKFNSSPDTTNGDAYISRYAAGQYHWLLFSGISAVAGGAFTAQLQTGGTLWNLSGTSMPTVGVIHEIGFTWDGTTGKLFVDGVKEAESSAHPGTLFAGTREIEINRYSSSDVTVSPAYISDVAIYDHVLSEARMLAQYNASL